MKKEIWRSVKGYKSLYQVSNYGRIKRLNYERYDKFYGNVKIPEKIIKGATKDGYKQVALFKDGIRELVFIHRLVAITFIPNKENKLFVNHKDSIRSNNYVDNLEWVTAQENSIHAHKSGTFIMPRGEDSVNTNLSYEDVGYIKNNPDKITQKELAFMFKMSQGGISKIKNNKNWKFHE